MKLNIKLNKNFQTQLNKLNEKYGEEFAKLNGLSEGDLDFTDFIDNFVDEETVADSSIDGNANVGQKDIVTMINEMPKAHQKLLAFNKLYYEMNKKYGFKEANKWLELEWTKALGMHDAHSSTEVPYCYKGDETVVIKINEVVRTTTIKEMQNFCTFTEKIWDESIQQEAFFPKNLFILDLNENGETQWSQVKRWVSHSNSKPMHFIKLANEKTFIVTEDHPCITQYGEVPAKDITQQHSMLSKQPADSANSETQYNSYYVIENIVCVKECPIVYDITTTSGHFLANDILAHNCFAYDLKDLAEKGLYFIENFNAQPPQHLATFVDFVKEHCSYASNRSAGAVSYPNLIPYFYYFWKKDINEHYMGITEEHGEEFARQQIQRLIYSLNQPFLRNSIQSAFTNTNIFDHPYFEAIFGGAVFPDGSFMIDSEEEIIEFQKIFLSEMSQIRSSNMMTFPVNTISLLTDEQGLFVDVDFAKWACEHNRKWNDSNWFIDSSVTSLSSCCRLRNDIQELGYTNSIGGAALKVGSVKVSTINLARIAYQSHSEQEYLTILKDTVEANCKILDVQRHIIQRNIEKGLLHNFDTKMIEMKYLYSSIGIMGIYETMRAFNYTTTDEFGNCIYKKEAYDFGQRIFKAIHAIKDAFLIDKDYHMNLEAIPGEAMAARFQTADEMLYPEQVIKDLPLYANQWIGLGIQTTIQERVKIAAAFSEYCSGGDILHINVDAPFDSFEKAWKMLNYVARKGVKYFAFTGKINACKNNHAFYEDICPVCGEPVETQYCRIVGFYVPIKTWSQTRKKEFSLRKWHNINDIKGLKFNDN